MNDCSSISLPIEFVNRITNTFGNAGKDWLKELPAQIQNSESHFNIQIGKSVSRLSYNYVANAKQSNGKEIVIKFGAPSSEFDQEIQALNFMQGDGVVNVIAYEPEKRIALLEKLIPGKMLTTVNDDVEATKIAAGIMKKIWKPLSIPISFQTTKQWFERLEQPIDLPSNFSHKLISKAKDIASVLHQDMGEAVLLHGDLHHFNILSASRQPWLAIDPKGVIGEREYEVGAFLRNPLPDIATRMDTKKILARRIDQFADLLEFDRDKISAWGFAQAVLAGIWTLDNKGNNWDIFLECANAFLG